MTRPRSSSSHIAPAVYDGYLADLIAGRRSECRRTVEALMAADTPVRTIYEGLFQDSLYEVGKRWEAGEVTVATEHLATAITEELIALVFPGAISPTRPTRSAIVSCAADEFHQVGGRIVADSLEMRGWDVRFIGANTPDDRLVAAVRERAPHVIALSVSINAHLPNVLRAIDAIRAVAPDIPVAVGGQGAAHAAEIASRKDDVHLIASLDDLDAWLDERFR